MYQKASPTPDSPPPPELRVLVLHNSDFPKNPAEGESPLSSDEQSRADVANSARGVARALAARGHFAEVQGIDAEDVPALLARLRQDPPDLVFNLVESLLGQDRHAVSIPTLLDLYDIPYTGSGPFCYQVTMHKYAAGLLLRAAGIATPLSTVLPALPRPRGDDLAAVQSIGYPLFLKLEDGSGSLGVSNRSLVQTDEELLHQLDFLRTTFSRPILAERFIAGREIYVSLVGNTPPQLFPLQEIDFSRLPSDFPHIVNENAKWIVGTPEYNAISSVAIGPLHPTIKARIEEVVRRAFALLDIRDYARCDVRLAEDGIPHIIDVNGNCDLSEGAGFARAATLAGQSYEQLIERIALSALQRTEDVRRRHPRPTGPRPHHSSGHGG